MHEYNHSCKIREKSLECIYDGGLVSLLIFYRFYYLQEFHYYIQNWNNQSLLLLKDL